jgi:hypothetical protein
VRRPQLVREELDVVGPDRDVDLVACVDDDEQTVFADRVESRNRQHLRRRLEHGK